MTISKRFSTTGGEEGMPALDDDGCDCSDVQISSAKIPAGRKLEKSWGSGSRVSGDSGYGERGIRSLAHHYEGGGVCILEDAKGIDDDGRVLVSRVSRVRTRRGIKRRRACVLDFKGSSGKRKIMVYDYGVCGKHLVSQDFPECDLRTDGFEAEVSIGETKIRKFGPSSVVDEEEVGGWESVQRICLNSLVSDEEEEVSVVRKKKRIRKGRRKQKPKKMEENEYVVLEGAHDRQEEEVGGCEHVQRLCLNSLFSDEKEEGSVVRKKKRMRKRRRKKKRKKMEENEHVVPEGAHDRQEEELGGCEQVQRLCLNSLVSDEEVSVVRKKKRMRKRRSWNKRRKKMEENEYVVPEGAHDLQEEEVGGCEQVQRLCLTPLVSYEEEEVSVLRKRKRKRKKKRKKMEENEYVVPQRTHDRQVPREEGEVEGEDDDELVRKEKQNDPSMNHRKRYVSEFAHCEDSVKRKRGEGGEDRPRTGDIVWANSSEEEWWPGWVLKANKLKVLVSIFGQGRFCWLSVFKLLPFEENYLEKSKNKEGQLKVAIDNALEELGKRAALGLICFCEGLMKFNEDEKSAVVDVPGYGKSSNYTLEQIIKARAEFRPLEMLSFLQKAALFVFINDSEAVGANRAVAQANAYRRFVSITPDWIYRETMRLTEVEHADEADKGNFEAEPFASSLEDNKVCYGARRSSNSLMVGVAIEEVEEQKEVEETEDWGIEEGAKNNLTMVERREEKKEKVHDRPPQREEFQRSDLQKSNVLLSLEESSDRPRNRRLLQEEIKGIEESEEDILDLGFCVTNEMDFSSLCSDEYEPQVSQTPEHTDMDVETNVDDGKPLSDHRIETVSSQANEFRINPQEHISTETVLPCLFETLTHLRRLALDPFYDSDGLIFVFKALLQFRDRTFLTTANLKSLEFTLDCHYECSKSADPKISVSPSYVADFGNYATSLREMKKDSFEISSTFGGRESPICSSFPSVPNSDMLSRSCQRMTTVASQECSAVDTKIPSLLDTLTHLRCLALDPFSEAVCVGFVSKAFLRYRAVTFLNIANLKLSEGTLNHHFKSGENATRETSAVLPSVTEQGNGTTSDCHAKKDSFEVGAVPPERDKVNGVSSSAVLDDAMLIRISRQETSIAFNAVNKLISNVQDNLSVEASMPSLCETLTHLRCLALDPFCDPDNLAFVCKAFLTFRAVSSSFSNVPSSDMLSRSCQHVTPLAFQGRGSVDTKIPSLLDALTHLRCFALDPFSGAVSAAFLSKAFLRYRAVAFLNITNLKFSEGTLSRPIKSVKNASKKTGTALPSVMEQVNGRASDCHAKKDIFEVGALPHERDKGVPCFAVPDDAMLSRISEQEANIAFSAVNKLILNVHDNLSLELDVPSMCEILTHLHFLALDPFYDPQNVAFVCKAFLRYRAVSSSFSNVHNSDVLSRSHQHVTALASQESGSVDIKMPSLLDTLTHLRCLALDPFSAAVSAGFVSKAFLRFRAVTFLNITNLKFSKGTLNDHFKSGENATTEASTVPPSVTEQGNGATSDCHAQKDTREVDVIPYERDKVKIVPCSAVPDDATLSRISGNTAFDAVNKLTSNVRNILSVETNVPSLCETLTHLLCLALDPFYDPENVAFVSKSLLRYRALSLNLKYLEDTCNHHCAMSNGAAQDIVMVTSTSISGSEDSSSIVHHDNKNFGIGGVLHARAEVRNISTSTVHSEKDQHSCKSQQTQNSVSLVKHMEDASFSSKSSTTSNKQQISTSNVVNLGKTAPGWSIHLCMHRSAEFPVAVDDDSPKDATNEDQTGEIKCKILALSERTSGFSVAESYEKRRTSLVSPGINAPSATSVGRLSETRQPLDEVTHDESFTVNHGDANSRGGLVVITSAKQHDFDDHSGPIAQRQYLGSSLATSLDEVFMFLRCLACDLSYGGDCLYLVKQAFLRYRVASYHKNSVEYRPGLFDSLEHSHSGSLSTTSWPHYIAATPMQGDSRSAAADRIPYVSMTIDNRSANSDGGLLVQMATDQQELNDATEICNSKSIAQGQFCSSSVTTPLGELYSFLRCLACDPFFGGERSTSAKRAFLRYRVAAYEKLCGSSAVEYRHGMSKNHECVASQSLSETWPNTRAITDRFPDDSHRESNVAPENNTNSNNQYFSSTTTTSANPQTNGSGCSQNVNIISEIAAHTDLSKFSGNSFPQKRKSEGIPAASPLRKLKRTCGPVLLGNWYASPLVRDGLSRSVDDVQVPLRCPTENTKNERLSISPGSHDEVGSYLHMKFPKNFDLPSQDQLMNTFRRFGPIDCLKTRVFFYTGSGQVCFQRHADAKAAFKFVREEVLFGQADIKFWVSRPAKSTHRVQRYNLSDSVGKPKSGESGNGDQSLRIDHQQLKDCDYTNSHRSQSLPISNVKSCLRKLSQPGDKEQPKSLKVTFSADCQSILPVVSIMSPLTLPCNHPLRKESGIYQQKILSLLKDCEQLIDNIRRSVGLESYYEMLIHELKSSFRKPDE